MFVSEDGTKFRTYKEYCNSPLLDEDIKVLLLSRGDRTPQNTYEESLKKELDRIKAEGKSFEVDFE